MKSAPYTSDTVTRHDGPVCDPYPTSNRVAQPDRVGAVDFAAPVALCSTVTVFATIDFRQCWAVLKVARQHVFMCVRGPYGAESMKRSAGSSEPANRRPGAAPPLSYKSTGVPLQGLLWDARIGFATNSASGFRQLSSPAGLSLSGPAISPSANSGMSISTRSDLIPTRDDRLPPPVSHRPTRQHWCGGRRSTQRCNGHPYWRPLRVLEWSTLKNSFQEKIGCLRQPPSRMLPWIFRTPVSFRFFATPSR